MTLQEIAEFAKKHKACPALYKPFVKAIKADETLAWQIVLDKLDWLADKGLTPDRVEVERLARGVAISYYPNGHPSYRSTYKNGNLHGICEGWNADGQLAYRFNYKNGKWHGLCEWWHGDGCPAHRSTYKNGKLHGLSASWRRDGQPWYRVNYQNGRRFGLSEWWEDGRLVFQGTYKNGVLEEA